MNTYHQENKSALWFTAQGRAPLKPWIDGEDIHRLGKAVVLTGILASLAGYVILAGQRITEINHQAYGFMAEQATLGYYIK